ncbi:MAG TPA: biopolymer transporter ExbD [Methylomusa anaerophila]|uniref:Biopolymer transport protein ExbD n=1 Tax=Methylomusa anaerophila TaxID=1930071 RepID=A0A348AM68_9FIRM|nr:biopolymer transporter ExbD [Methylomusa anaerophila]BBB89423.1 biopolymer transport protein ExbD [Methylomusa anaerophila]BBB92166.1 biopolymer transport protein ExbD [Methylomusa anaerophila]HML87820.1 biopolymer transporter ExbD [Methylomusa anaerophila]
MKLRSLRNERQPRLMIIPMIDIIFFLLVFFMMSTLYMVEQQIIPVNLPQAASAQTDRPRSVSVLVTKEGRILLEQEDIPLELLKQRVQAELSKQNDIVFILRSDKQAEYGKVVAVLDELKLAGVQRVAIATEKKGR